MTEQVEYSVDNPNNPIYASLYQQIPLFDDEGNALIDDEGKHRCKLVCVNGGASVTSGNVKAAILQAFKKNRLTIQVIQQDLQDMEETIASSVGDSKTEVLEELNTKITSVNANITALETSLTNSINALDTKSTTADTNLETSLLSEIAQAKNELNSSITALKTTINSVSSAKVTKTGDSMTGQLAVPSIKINGHTVTVG